MFSDVVAPFMPTCIFYIFIKPIFEKKLIQSIFAVDREQKRKEEYNNGLLHGNRLKADLFSFFFKKIQSNEQFGHPQHWQFSCLREHESLYSALHSSTGYQGTENFKRNISSLKTR